MILSVINADNSEGLEVKTAIRDAELVDGVYVYDESTTDKPDALIAEKFFASPMKITVNKRWPDGGARPIKVILYEVITTEENGKTTQEKVELDRITLDPSCNWQHTFTELDTRKEYVLDEIGYSGYHESYSYNTENPLHWFVTITNYKSLFCSNNNTYIFYNKNNIFILGEDKISRLNEFLYSDYSKIPNKIIDYYCFENWLQRIINYKNINK